LRVLLIVLAGFLLYAPALAGDWLWDDSRLIPENASLRSLSGLGDIWLSQSDWALTSTALWIQWHLWGPLPFGYHAVNLLLHLANGFLVWHLLSRLGLRWAWLGGLLFVLHPLAVESVAWISEFKNTLSLLFFLLSLLAWIDQDEGKGGYLRSLLYYLAALLGKTSVIMLPAILLLYGWWKHGRITRRDLRKTIPFFVLALLLGLVTLHFQANPTPESADVQARGLLTRLDGAGVDIFFYLGKFLWPSPLLPIYPRWTLDPPSWPQLLTLPLLVLVFFGLWTQRRGWGRHALLGFGFFVLNLLPVLGLIDMTYLNFSWVADHFVYLPMIGLIGLTVAGLEAVASKIAPLPRFVLMATVAVAALLLAGKAHRYAGLFTQGEKLWAYTLDLNPTSWAAHNNFGYVLLQSGRVGVAEKQFEIALRLNPLSADAHNNRGVVCLQTGRYADAVDEFETALRLDPYLVEARDNLEIARGKIKKPED
jgi:protein O-mannosyl-transferase